MIDCEDCNGSLDTETWRDVFDAGRKAGYDIPAKQSTEQRASATDGGAAGDDETNTDTDTDSRRDPLTPSEVMAAAGLGEDDHISDLTDRQKAYWVYDVIDRSDDEHLLAAQPDGTLYRYDGGLWTDDGEQRLRELASKALGSEYSQNVLRELKEQVRARTTIQRDDMGAPAGTIATENGLLDLESRELRELRPDDRALFRLGAEFDPDADCPRFREFIGDVLRPEDIEPLQEYAGYCLHHWGQPYKRAILLLGPQDSGKSTFLHIIKAILGGSENVASENLNSLVNTRLSVFG